jgi:hypothetical protein
MYLHHRSAKMHFDAECPRMSCNGWNRRG